MTKTSEFWLATCSARPTFYAMMAFALFLLVNNGINAASVWTEHSRDPHNSLDWWEPWLWEYSSAAATWLLAPLLCWSFQQQPLRFSQPRRQLCWHFCGSLLFCLAHVGLMVGIRELVYGWRGDDYNFGPLARELWYEYRKDVWGYLNLLVTYQLCCLIWRRLRGEASLLSADTPAADSDCPPAAHGGTMQGTATPVTAQSAEPAPPGHGRPVQQLLVKKLDKEFLLQLARVDYLQACGNYVNLHCDGRIYPLRATLAQLTEQLGSQGFVRVHRSFAVNQLFIAEISYEPSGDGEIRLRSGQLVPLSRRYKEPFRAAFTLGGQQTTAQK